MVQQPKSRSLVLGFSLIEMMAASAIIFLILGLTGALVGDYSRVLRHNSPREAMLEVVELGLERVSSEVSGAIELVTPASGTTSVIDFDRINPNTERLPTVMPSPAEDSWDYRNPDDILSVSYSVDSGVLIRETASATVTTSEAVCRSLSGLSATRVNAQCLRVRMSVDVEGALHEVTREVYLWVEP